MSHFFHACPGYPDSKCHCFDKFSPTVFIKNADPGDESDLDAKRESESVSEGFGHPDSLAEDE